MPETEKVILIYRKVYIRNTNTLFMKERLTEYIYKYTCERCGKEWLQRIKAEYKENGLKIKQIIRKDPKNCTECKSPAWNKPRGT